MTSQISRPIINQPIPPNGKKVFQGKIFDVYQWEQRMYDGSTRVFEKLKRADTVVILAITNENTILISYEEQPGKNPYINLPGGGIEVGEDVVSAGQRELLEETGYLSNNFELLFSEQPATKIDYIVFFLIAKECKKVADQNLGSGEKIITKEVTFEEFMKILLLPDFVEKEIKLAFLLAEKNGTLDDLKNILFN